MTTKEKEITDQEYIQGLEYLVNSLASVYQTNYEKFYWENFKTCDYTNPDRRELTELENTIIMKFTTYQGGFRDKVKKMANLKISQPNDINLIVSRLLNHPETPPLKTKTPYNQ